MLALGLYAELAGRWAAKVRDPPDLTEASSSNVSGEDAVLTHTQLAQAPRERKDPGGGTRQRRPPGSRRPPPWHSALEFAAGRGPALSWMCAPAEPRERHGLRVEHLEQQLARSPAVYHRKGRPGTRASVNCSNALFLGREPAARGACALGNPEFGEGEAWGERHMVRQTWFARRGG